MRNFGEIEGIKVAITDHALTRLCEMELSAEQIKHILFEPEETKDSPKYPGALCYRVGDHVLAATRTDDGVLVIVTALYATSKAWLRASLEGKLGEGREWRPDNGLPRF